MLPVNLVTDHIYAPAMQYIKRKKESINKGSEFEAHICLCLNQFKFLEISKFLVLHPTALNLLLMLKRND
ncbi:hypothetical protein CUMW_171930 [Citrus unshiu]|uniref:Uncharacterized protein n=1 Tax=Citrus unshiu TaxID=55188 RepID=A0A2H5PVN7_CITUN|nr:hypothetical protein CUMW_171930 [Citrus unshiu]